MPEHKDQKIVILTELAPTDKTIILNGIKLASVFRKELCLAYNYSQKEKRDLYRFKNELQNYANPVKSEIPGLKVSTLLFSESTKELPDILAETHEAILLVANSGNFKKYSKALTESSIPFLFIPSEGEVSEYNHIVLPIDLRTENSDSALWSSYFGRYNYAEIVVVAANDKGKEEQKQVAKNVILTKKLFSKFNIRHKVFKGTKSSFRNSFEALELALSSNSN
ncbi:MAG: hypothetical protein ABFS16_14065, partial [Bacteroidota bacterium]